MWELVCIRALPLAHSSSSWCWRGYSLSCEFCTDVPGGLLYAHDQVLIVDTYEECISKLTGWKIGMKSKGFHVDMEKTKFLLSDVTHDVLEKSGKYLCAVCCGGVGKNSTQCAQCMLWVNMNCRSITKLLVGNPNYACRKCNRKMSTAPYSMWKPNSTATYCALVGTVTVPLLPDVVWPGASSGNFSNSFQSKTPYTSHLGYVAKWTRPAFVWLCFTVSKGRNRINLNCSGSATMICHDPLDMRHQRQRWNITRFTTTEAWH